VISPRASSSLRAPWFEVACCPPNVARTFASLAAYVATSDDDGVQIHQYAPASIRTSLPDGRGIAVDIRTNYPSDGVIEVQVAEDMPVPTTLALRIPSWATSATLAVRSVDGTTTRSEPEPGYASVRRAFRAGDEIVLTLPMRPRFTIADPRIDAVRDCVAVERGPQVYCLESTDLPAQFGSIDGLQVDDDIAPMESGDVVAVMLRNAPASANGWPYSTLPADVGETEGTAAVQLVPYNRWAERGPSTMRVWIPVHHDK
jgi:DUF1680 family protein